MLGLSMNLGMTSGSVPSGPAAGPTVSSAPTVDSSTATVNVLLTATGGTYAASGGGSVSVVREWLSAGVQSATGLTDTPVVADVGNSFVYRETATETGGTNPGSVIRQVSLGNVVNVAASDLSTIRTAMETATHYVVTGDSRRDNSYNDMVDYYIPHMLDKAGITTVDNAASGLAMEDWADNTGTATSAQAIAAIPGTGSTTVMEFSGGINDIDASATQTAAGLLALIRPGIDAILAAKPNVTLFFVKPTPVASAARNTVLGEFHDLLGTTYGVHVVDVYSQMIGVYDGTDPVIDRVFYEDSTHPNRYGSFRIFNYILSQILPDSLLSTVTLDTDYYSGTIEALAQSLDFNSLTDGQYWNSGGGRSNNASWASFDIIAAVKGQLVRIEHSSNRDDVRIYDGTPDNTPGGATATLLDTYTVPDLVNGNVYEYSVTTNGTVSVGANVSSAGGYVPAATDKIEVFDIVKIKTAADLTQAEMNVGLPARGTWFDDVVPTVPAAFLLTDWTLTDEGSGGTATVVITSMPDNGGSAITDVEYDIAASGTWISGGDINAFDIPGLTDGVSNSIRIRAVNSAGQGDIGTADTVTTSDTVAPVVNSYSFDGTDTITSNVSEAGDWYWLIDDNSARTAAQVVAGGGLASGNFSISAGANSDDIDVGSVSAGNHYLHGVPRDPDGNAADAQVQSGSQPFSGTVPDAFVDANWSIADAATGGDADVTIASLPTANSDTITDVEYKVGAGSWVSSGGTVSFTITGAFTDGVSTGVILRAVSGAGNGADGNSESVTTTAGGDVTAPTLSSATDAANGATASTGSVSTNEGNGTLYYVVTTSATAPTAAQVKLGQDNSGSAATFNGSQSVSGTGVQTVTPAPSGLTASTAYTTHFMHEDAATNQSTVVSASGFTTTSAGTTPVWERAGTAVGSGSTLTVVLPTHASGDLLVVPLEMRGNDSDSTLPAGWTLHAGAQTGSGSGDTKFNLYYKFATSSSETNPFFDNDGNHKSGQAHVISRATAIAQLGLDSTGNGTAVTVTSGTTGGANRLIMVVSCNETDTATDQITSWTNSNLTSVTDRGGAQVINASGGGFDVMTGEKATAGAVGDTTATLASSSDWAAMTLEIS